MLVVKSDKLLFNMLVCYSFVIKIMMQELIYM